MRSDVKIDWDWADGHIGAIVDVLKQNAMHLLSVHVASQKQDLKHATDLVISVVGGDVAVRIRRPQYRKCWRELTVRAWRKGDIPTELHKIRDGWADWYLYAWSDGNGGLLDWMLVDLDAMRKSGLLDNPKIQMNKDGRTGFCHFSVGTLKLNSCLVSLCPEEVVFGDTRNDGF